MPRGISSISSFTLVGNDVKKIIAFYQQCLKQNSFLLLRCCLSCVATDKSKKENLNVYQIGRFLFSLKKNFINAAKL
jgi:hypothetical protein